MLARAAPAIVGVAHDAPARTARLPTLAGRLVQGLTLVLERVRVGQEGVGGSQGEVVADVLEVAAVVVPRPGGRDVVCRALACQVTLIRTS